MDIASLKIRLVVSEMFGQNSYVTHLDGHRDCIVVDPGFDPEAIIESLETEGLVPAAILNTHGHADHIAGNRALKDRWPECSLVIGDGDEAKLTDATLNLSRPFGLDVTSPGADRVVQEGEVLSSAGVDLHVLAVPGHSAGHVAFVWKGSHPWVAFVGDVLFQGSVGRTDFPDGDAGLLAQSIRTRLYTLPDDTVLLPGHGPRTTIGAEKRYNPFVRG